MEIFSAIACNRAPQCLALRPSNGSLIYCAGTFVAVLKPNRGQCGLRTLKGHKAKVTCVEYFKDSEEWILSGSADKCCILWRSVGDGWVEHTRLEGHQAGIIALAALASDSVTLLATSDSANVIKIWQRDELVFKCIQEINIAPHHPMALSLCFLPNSNSTITINLVPVLFSGGSDLNLTLFVSKNGLFEKRLSLAGHTDWIRSIKVATYTGSHDTKYNFEAGDLMIASASQDKYIRIWKLSSKSNDLVLDAMKLLQGTQLSTKAHFMVVENQSYSVLLDAVFLGHDDWVLSANWQPRTQKNGLDHQPMSIVSASADKAIITWTPDSHSDSWIPSGRVGEVGGTTLGFYGAIFSADGSYLYSNGYNGAIHVWESSIDVEWSPRIGVSGHSLSVEDCAWDPSGTYLLSISLDQTARIFAFWDQEKSWHEIARSQIHGYNLHCCAFTSKYQYVSGADEKIVRVFDASKNFAESLEAITGIKELDDIKNSRPEGANLPALGLSNKVNFESNLAIIKEPPFEETLLQNTLWPEREKMYGHGYELISMTASKDGKFVASTSKASKAEHANIRLWSTENWTEVCEPLKFHTLTVTCLAFSNSSKMLLSAGRDRSWALFELRENGWNLKQNGLKAHGRIIWDCAFSHDDQLFVTASRDKTLKLYERDITGEYRILETIIVDDVVTSLDFYHSNHLENGYLIGLGFESGALSTLTFRVVSNKIEDQKMTFIPNASCHGDVVKSVKWRPFAERLLATCSQDGSVRLFSL